MGSVHATEGRSLAEEDVMPLGHLLTDDDRRWARRVWRRYRAAFITLDRSRRPGVRPDHPQAG